MSETDPFAIARQIADAVIYEGYVLYPYRASSRKNQSRWQFGVLMPSGYVEVEPSERDACQTQIVFEAPPAATLRVQLRFLHLQHRTGGGLPEWDETVERQLEFSVPTRQLMDGRYEHPFSYEGASSSDEGVLRVTAEISGAVVVEATCLPGPFGALRLGVRVENHSDCDALERDGALRRALVAAHTMYALDHGHFVSMTDPPEWAKPEVAACDNIGSWPVLVAGDQLVLSSPIILEDNPQIAPESPGNLYDSTEIDEILTLRTLVLTDAEKAEARATDPRASAVIDHVEALPQEHLDRLHGAMRYLRQVTGESAATPTGWPAPHDEPPTLTTPIDGLDGFPAPTAPWWDPGADSAVSPETDSLIIDGVRVSRGSRVRLHPGARRTDAQDLFLRGKTATVEAVFFDVDGQQHLGVTPDEDPELAEIQRWHGRFLYFAPDEVQPLVATPSTAGQGESAP